MDLGVEVLEVLAELGGGADRGVDLVCSVIFGQACVALGQADAIASDSYPLGSVQQFLANKFVAVAAFSPYVSYYFAYRTQGSFSKYLPDWANSLLTDFETFNLDRDAHMDVLKARTGSVEKPNDENENGGALPYHLPGVDKKPGDPLYTYLPGIDYQTGSYQVGPNDYGWEAGWGPRKIK